MTLGRWRRHTALLERQCQEVYRSSAASLLHLGDRARKDSVERCRPFAHSVKAGVQPQEIGVFVRSQAELRRARAAVEGAKLPVRMLDEQVEGAGVSIGTMHRAKGLEFRAVVVMACDDEIIPSDLQQSTIGDERVSARAADYVVTAVDTHLESGVRRREPGHVGEPAPSEPPGIDRWEAPRRCIARREGERRR